MVFAPGLWEPLLYSLLVLGNSIKGCARLWCPSLIAVPVIEHQTKSNTGKERFIWLTIPGYSPSLWRSQSAESLKRRGLPAICPQEQRDNECMFTTLRMLSPHLVWGPALEE